MDSRNKVVEAIICASCPENFHDEAVKICKQHGIQKAFGKADDMIDNLQGNDWVPKWQAKVVMAVVTKAQTLNVDRAKIICIQGGPYCDQEFSHQPILKKAILKEMDDPNFRVKVEWLDFAEFCEMFPSISPVVSGESTSDTPIINAQQSSELRTTLECRNEESSDGKQQPNNSRKRDEKLTSTIWICGECEEQFDTEQQFQQHQKDYRHIDPQCRCGKVFNSKMALRQHCTSKGHTPHTIIDSLFSFIKINHGGSDKSVPIDPADEITNSVQLFAWHAMKDAITAKDLAAIKSIHEKNPNFNFNGYTKIKFGVTTCVPLLTFAVQTNDIDIIMYFIENGARVNCNCTRLETPLMSAVRYAPIELIKLLLRAGADPNLGPKGNGCGSLAITLRSQDVSVIKLLFEFGLDPNSFDGELTLLSSCAQYNKVALVETILDAGADVLQKNVNGTLAIDVCSGNRLPPFDVNMLNRIKAKMRGRGINIS